MTGRFPLPFNGPSSAWKAALEPFAGVYRAELGPFGVDFVMAQAGNIGDRLRRGRYRPQSQCSSARTSPIMYYAFLDVLVRGLHLELSARSLSAGHGPSLGFATLT
jgi:hypothetical protein